VNNRRYESLLAEMQRLRGSIYLGDGAIWSKDLTADGRHVLKVDEQSWHILKVDDTGAITGCLRFFEERPTNVNDLWICNSAIAKCPVWGARFLRAVEREVVLARKRGMVFGEVGGWAVAVERRWTPDPLRMVLAACGLLRLLGGCIGLATATLRHGSATILRRMGLSPLMIDGMVLPSYYDAQYGCQMEALRFDSEAPNPKYGGMISEMCAEIESTAIICRDLKVVAWPDVLRGPEVVHQKLPKLPSLAPAV
jgi:hypothetical protein